MVLSVQHNETEDVRGTLHHKRAPTNYKQTDLRSFIISWRGEAEALELEETPKKECLGVDLESWKYVYMIINAVTISFLSLLTTTALQRRCGMYLMNLNVEVNLAKLLYFVIKTKPITLNRKWHNTLKRFVLCS